MGAQNSNKRRKLKRESLTCGIGLSAPYQPGYKARNKRQMDVRGLHEEGKARSKRQMDVRGLHEEGKASRTLDR